MKTHYLVCLAAVAGIASGQVQTNASLLGKFYFRHVLLLTDGTANVLNTISATGTLTFDGNGNFTVTGQQLTGSTPAATLSSPGGTYSVKPGGFVTLTNILHSGSTINARLGSGALVGSSTEAGPTVFDMFIAIPAPFSALSNSTLTGPYYITSLEFPNGGLADIRETNFKLTSNGSGAFAENSVTGQAANLGNVLTTQTVSPMTYAVASDGSGTLTFPTASGLSTTTQLISGVKNIYVGANGSYFIGGSTSAGGHGIVIGVSAFANGLATNANWRGFYWAAGLRFDTSPARLAATVGAVNATGAGQSIWSRRTRQSDGIYDASLLIGYNLSADGSGPYTTTAGQVDLDLTGQMFTTTGVYVSSSESYEMYFGMQFVPQSGTGVFLNPQGVLNSASFAPPGYPLSPGGLMTLFATGLGSANGAAVGGKPFPTTLAGVQVSVNGTAAPIYSVSSSAGQISAVVPFEATGSTATVVMTVGGTPSNSVTVPLASTAPSIFTQAQDGFGDGAILHANFSIVNSTNPATLGETVQIFLTGLGPVSPAVADGALGPSTNFAKMVEPVNVYVGGQLATVTYAGVAPGLAGLYQLNIQIPASAGVGEQPLAIQTNEAFTGLATIFIQ